MEAVVLSDAQILIPNQAHQNFTRSNQIIKKGTKVKGEPKVIKGLYRGNPFEYNLFYTDKNEIIFMKHINPKHMNKTEVTLGADAAQSPTTIKFPTNSNLGKRPVIGVLVGAALGYGFAKWRKIEGNKKHMFTIAGAVAGFVIGKYLQSHNDIKVSTSK